MASLADVLLDESKKSEVVEACCKLIDEEVDDKGGISGLAIKAGYGVVKGVKPGFVKKVVTDLLPEFVGALEPTFQKAQSENKPVAAYFESQRATVADALLAITDARAAKASGAVKSTYDKLRGTAKKNVEAAVPRLGALVQRFAG